jgi:hypothetical protein
MACTLFGGVSILDPDFGEIFRKFVDSCIADGRHPKAKWVSNKDLALYCCDKATDTVSLERETGEIRYELTLPGKAALDLFGGNPVRFTFGRGTLEFNYVAPEKSEVICLWKGEKYSVGAIVKHDDGKCHRCEVDGTWGAGTPCD